MSTFGKILNYLTNSSNSFEQFKETFKGVATIEGDPEYDVGRWAENAVRKAKYVVYPIDNEDVSKAILFATQENLDLAVKCGGHSTSGSSSSTGGMVIDLSRDLNDVTIDTDKNLAFVKGGTTVGTWKAKAFEHGLAGCYGMVDSVGVGGLTTGGGIGNQIGERGMTLDTLVAATVVVANGDILGASEKDNADLFWGIRGGGSNFGVVTEFVFQLYPQRPDVYSCSLIFPSQKLPVLASEIDEWQKNQELDETAQITMAADSDGNPVIIFSGYKNSSEEAGISSFSRFAALGPLSDNSGQIPFMEYHSLLVRNAKEPRFKINSGTVIKKATVAILQRSLSAFSKLISEYPTTSTSIIIWEYYNMEKVTSIPLESTAFPGRSKDMGISIQVQWDDPAFTLQASAEVRHLIQVMHFGDQMNEDHVERCYANYADELSVLGRYDSAQRMFGLNYERMRQVKRKYDPDIRFNKWFTVEPAE